MTEDKLVERLRLWGEHGLTNTLSDLVQAADRIEALTAKLAEADAVLELQNRDIARLREALREVFEQWAGSEGFIPETAPEGYLLHLTKRMADIARAALEGKQ